MRRIHLRHLIQFLGDARIVNHFRAVILISRPTRRDGAGTFSLSGRHLPDRIVPSASRNSFAATAKTTQHGLRLRMSRTNFSSSPGAEIMLRLEWVIETLRSQFPIIIC